MYGKKQVLLLFVTLFVSFDVFSQTMPPVCFTNSGAMYVAPKDEAGETSLYIGGSVHVKASSAIYQQGITKIGGNFYHDAATNVFYFDGVGFPSSGRITFFKNYGESRQITTRDNSIDYFSRKDYYIAFPELEIETTDELLIPARMGIDALRIIADASAGKMRLESKVYGTNINAKVYDASLRITGSGLSENLVPPGSVIVERDVTPYRIEVDNSGSGSLFAFSSPFKNLRSGYFAGNWIRKMLEGQNEHVRYVYGNKSENGTIIQEQYIVNPEEMFVPSRGYLIKLRKENFPYEELIDGGGLGITGDNPNNYNKNKFIFNGTVYNLGFQNKQLFAEDVLFQRSINAPGTRDTTINWVIGNSYTAPIGINKLIDLMGSSSLYFEPNIYVFPAGSTTYQIYQVMPGNNSMQVIDIDEIPAMSYFMIRLDKAKSQIGTFTLNKSNSLVQGNSSHSMKRAASYNNEVVFRVSPESNQNIYDLAGIALRTNGNVNADKYDIIKAGDDRNELFQLYTMSGDGKMLLANILPDDTKQVKLYFSPGLSEGKFRFDISRIESLTTEGFWLEDLIERRKVDLRDSDGSYTFNVNSNDNPERFIVHFDKMLTNIDDTYSDSFLQAHYADGMIIVKGLLPEDMNSSLRILDLQGRILLNQRVLHTPEMSMNVSIPDGIYLLKLEGSRTKTLKFRK